MKLKDGTTAPFEAGDKVIYIPQHLLLHEDKTQMVKEEHLGKVSSKNDTYVFVIFKGNTTAHATSPHDLYFLHNRPDLAALID